MHAILSIFDEERAVKRARALLVTLAFPVALAGNQDHRQFDATIDVPFRVPGGSSAARRFMLQFEYPSLLQAQSVMWRVALVAGNGRVIRRWYGVAPLHTEEMLVPLEWNGLDGIGLALPDGLIKVALSAIAIDSDQAGTPISSVEDFVEAALAHGQGELVEQQWDMQVGSLRPAAMLSARQASPQQGHANGVAGTSLPYRVVYGNLHSQTNHSDGGGPLATCKGAQEPLASPFGPAHAYQFALGHGLDFLMASEHNHLFDGSDGNNPDASPLAAKALYQSGLAAAAAFNNSHPGFVALYGMEWGVINNGGHLNVFGSTELMGWERNKDGDLLADRYTPKGDYPGLYTSMRQLGLLGQFNHPASNGQFFAGGRPLGWTEDGDQVMALCEVMNTSAFSNRDDESETRRSTYEMACQKALEAGFHLAFSSDQDNHCANWGASYTNRTALLIPEGMPFNTYSFEAAIRARRVFATMDKHAQLLLTANGHVMGERFSNAGILQLDVHHSHEGERQVAMVQVFEGVPGRNGTVTQLSGTMVTRLQPSIGAHFYYARVTQDDGKVLWSAPVWVEQVPMLAKKRKRRQH
jgi:hypothetical protein